MVVAGGDKAADSPVGFRSEWKGLPQPVEPASWQQGTHQETSFSQSSCDTGVTLIPIVHSRSWASEMSVPSRNHSARNVELALKPLPVGRVEMQVRTVSWEHFPPQE